MTRTTTRRSVLGAAAALAAVPAAFAAPTVSAPAAAGAAAASPIRALWDDVINLSVKLGDFNTPIVNAQSGLPGWMYDRGEANALGHARYEKLIQILNASPRTSEDMGIVARAAAHVDIENGPRTYGAVRLAAAARSMAA
jgi:hypothetical protein